MEKWKRIPGYEDYQVSTLGRVINSHGKIMKLWLFSPKSDGVKWQDRKKLFPVHRIVLMTFIGIPPDKHEGCHRNDIKTDNRLENLYWGTRKQNIRDQIRNKTFHFTNPGAGEKHAGSKYSDKMIQDIRSEYHGVRGQQKELSDRYGIDCRYICAIVNNKVRNIPTKEVGH